MILQNKKNRRKKTQNYQKIIFFVFCAFLRQKLV